ncbi:hypothetical protein NS506_04685 [Nocardia seriolae]|uniref:Uncharacterized protein n=1 Tax=Nocardia seriolae TaxID=37332 RepID=A0ABC8AWD3_9NOCA|nr:hypothetical protein NS506_04685 [Nocardia seriolae]BAW07321.1 hypothetical protein NSERUTF1_4175 [Nocardia seriolae]
MTANPARAREHWALAATAAAVAVILVAAALVAAFVPYD